MDGNEINIFKFIYEVILSISKCVCIYGVDVNGQGIQHAIETYLESLSVNTVTRTKKDGSVNIIVLSRLSKDTIQIQYGGCHDIH